MKLRVLSAKNIRTLYGNVEGDVLRALDSFLDGIGLANPGGSVTNATNVTWYYRTRDGAREPLCSVNVVVEKNGAIDISVSDEPMYAPVFTPSAVVCFCNKRVGITFSLPLLHILKEQPSKEGSVITYAHTIGLPNGIKSYIGVTKQGWLKRYAQHIAAAKSGSPYLFHEALREMISGRLASASAVITVSSNKERAYAIEEHLVERLTLHPNGLNMVPGGYAGLDYLRSIGALNDRNQGLPRDRIISDFYSSCVKAKRPNPLISARWRDDAYATSVICGNHRNLSVEQVQRAKGMLAIGAALEDVMSDVGIRNMRIAEALATGKTYSRVH